MFLLFKIAMVCVIGVQTSLLTKGESKLDDDATGKGEKGYEKSERFLSEKKAGGRYIPLYGYDKRAGARAMPYGYRENSGYLPPYGYEKRAGARHLPTGFFGRAGGRYAPEEALDVANFEEYEKRGGARYLAPEYDEKRAGGRYVNFGEDHEKRGVGRLMPAETRGLEAGAESEAVKRAGARFVPGNWDKKAGARYMPSEKRGGARFIPSRYAERLYSNWKRAGGRFVPSYYDYEKRAGGRFIGGLMEEKRGGGRFIPQAYEKKAGARFVHLDDKRAGGRFLPQIYYEKKAVGTGFDHLEGHRRKDDDDDIREALISYLNGDSDSD